MKILLALLATVLHAQASVLEHGALTIGGEEVSLAEKYKGKVVLVVNVASKCGYTRQYAQLQKLHEVFSDKGLRIVGFPCNDFGGQEPGTAAEIEAFCTKNFGVEFDMMSKVSVKPGDDQHPLFKALTGDARFPGAIRWNFEKFVIGRDGKLANRFRSATGPGNPGIVDAIRWELADAGGRKEQKLDPPALVEYMGREIGPDHALARCDMADARGA